jgi:predicted CopG family antitoxin
MHILKYGGDSMVRVISISDEVYYELARMKNGMSFTELLKTLISKCEKKGDPESILEFLKAKGPILSEESAKRIMDEVESGRKRSMPRKLE